MRRWRRWLAALVLLLFAALVLAPVSSTGTRLLAAVANRVPGVALEGVEGRLFGALRVDSVTLALPGLDLELEGLRSMLRPACLPRGELCFRDLAAELLRVTVATGQGSGGRPPPLPVPLRADRVTLATLALTVDDTALLFHDLAAERLRARSRQITAAPLALRLDGVGSARATVRLTVDRGWPLAVDGVFRPAAGLHDRLPAGVEVTAPLAVAASGPPTDLALSVSGTATVPALGGSVKAAAEGTLRWPALAIGELGVDSPGGSVTARGEADLAGPSARLAFTVSNLAPRQPGWPLAPASGSGRLRVDGAAGPQVLLSGLQLTSGWQAHPLAIAGEVAWEPAMTVPRLALSGTLAGQPWQARGGGGQPVALSAQGGQPGEPFRAGDFAVDALALEGTFAADGSRLALQARARGLRAGAAVVERVEAQGTVTFGERPALVGTATAVDARIDGRQLSSLRIAAEGSRGGVRISAVLAGDLDGELSTRLEPAAADSWSLTLDPFGLETPAGELTLAEPVAVQLLPGPWRARFPAHCWVLERVSLCLAAGEAGSAGEVSAELAGQLVLPPGSLGAVAEADARLAGQLRARWGGESAPSLGGSLQLDRIRIIPADQGGPLDDPGTLTISLEQAATLSFSGELAGGALGPVQLAGGRDAQGWEGQVTVGGAPLAYLQPLLPGVAVVDGTVSGQLALAAPGPVFVTGGSLALGGGRLRLAGSEAELEELAVTLTPGADGDLAIAGSARLGGGPVTLAGTLAPAAPRLALMLKGERNAVHWPRLVDATVSPDLTLAYREDTASLEGELRVHSGRLAPDQVGTGGVAVSPDTVVVGEERPDALLRTRIDLRIVVEDRFRVVGELLDATVGGDLRLRQEEDAPVDLFGQVGVVGGELRAYGQQLELREGSIAFAGDPENPELSLRAERQFPRESLRVGFTVAGSLRDPRLALYSEPQLPREAQLSWLVRGRPPDAGASMDGTALALSVGASTLNQTSLVRSLNRLPGLSNVSLGTEDSDAGTAATISGYVGDRLYLSYGMGLYEPVNTLTARLYLRARLWLEMVSALENSVDLYYRFDID